MSRGPRFEFDGAIYHIICRGNYRKDLFAEEVHSRLFEKMLFEACEDFGWILHAYVLMSNHYHLALETPVANLGVGMRWLQSTFAFRFNRLVRENGHVFQGRYKAIPIQPGHHLATLVNYIHLNPVRAGVCNLSQLPHYEYGSYSKFFKNRCHPVMLSRSIFLRNHGFSDSDDGMARYATVLDMLLRQDPEEVEALWQSLNESTCIGDQKFKEMILDRMQDTQGNRTYPKSVPRDLGEVAWARLMSQLLKEEGKSQEDILNDKKGADWKRRIAIRLRKEARASNAWTAKMINCGHPSYISKWIAEDRSPG